MFGLLRCDRQIVRVFFNRHSFGIVVSESEDDKANRRPARHSTNLELHEYRNFIEN
jgi:hypothetical protein